MSLISRLLSVVRSWGGPRVAKKPARRTIVTMEQLDHRQLLAVNFTGNVAIDFPATMQPGVVVIPDNPSVTHPTLSPALAPIIKVSGFDINGIRATYDSATDTLSIGLEQPLNQKPGLDGIPGQVPVIAGDADNNGNSGTVDPATLAASPGFQEFPGLQGPQGLGAFLDFTGTGYADVVAGFSPNSAAPLKLYQVATANVNRNLPPTSPANNFGTPLPNNTGNVYLNNSPLHPNLEFNITNFSQLYQSITGKPLTPATNIGIGAFGVASNNIGVGDAFFPPLPINIGQATTPIPVIPVCPPASPPVVINPHSHNIIDSAHRSNVRVTVFGSSGLDVTQIDPTTVRLGGATPFRSFPRKILPNGFSEETFVFKGTDINLPPGLTTATLTGQTFTGTQFSTSETIFNKDSSFYSPAQVAARDRRLGMSANAMAAALVADNVSPVASQVNAVAAQAAQVAALQAPTLGTPTLQSTDLAPMTVPIPNRVSVKAKGSSKLANSRAPTMTSAASFRNSNHLRTAVGQPNATTTSQSMAAQDAAIASLASQPGSMPQTAA